MLQVSGIAFASYMYIVHDSTEDMARNPITLGISHACGTIFRHVTHD